MEEVNEVELQLEILKIQLDSGAWMSWFFSIYSIIFALMLYFYGRIELHLFMSIPPILMGLALIFPGYYWTWKEKNSLNYERNI